MAATAQRLALAGHAGSGLRRRFLLETRDVMVAMVTVIILTLFLLAGGPPVLARMTAALASDAQATQS
jgi:hypothetical protein